MKTEKLTETLPVAVGKTVTVYDIQSNKSHTGIVTDMFKGAGGYWATVEAGLAWTITVRASSVAD